jgi:hypothetical protein
VHWNNTVRHQIEEKRHTGHVVCHTSFCWVSAIHMNKILLMIFERLGKSYCSKLCFVFSMVRPEHAAIHRGKPRTKIAGCYIDSTGPASVSSSMVISFAWVKRTDTIHPDRLVEEEVRSPCMNLFRLIMNFHVNSYCWWYLLLRYKLLCL